MPLISVVIVSYNVKYFLRQCIQSLLRSDIAEGLEIIVVDNNSTDGSSEMLSSFGSQIKLIANTENLGFSKANNQGIANANGEYLLILNPDTLVEEDTISKCLEYMRKDISCAALAVKMIDGSGKFLPESKRGFPTPLSAFFKLSGLNRVFPKSSFFNSYYQGHLSPKDTNAIEVISGAFVFTKTRIIHEIGGFDEDYFMYGEDIELSFRLKEAGYKIVYFPDTQIVHFKGESTNKSSFDYIKNFYGAMHKYASKRNNSSGFIWNILIQFGILITSVSGFVKNVLIPFIRPVLDFILIAAFAKLIQYYWARIYFSNPDYYKGSESNTTLLILSIVLIFFFYLFGQYDKKHNLKHLLYGFVFGSFAMFTVYSFLPGTFRFSRIVLLILALLSPFILYISRRLYNFVLYNNSRFDNILDRRIAVVGSESSFKQVKKIVDLFSKKSNVLGYFDDGDENALSALDEIGQAVRSRNINELIFCSKDLTSQFIFERMSNLGEGVSFKIANDDNTSILGSDSKNRVGQWYTLDINFKIDQHFHRRTKRLIDLVSCPLILILSPIILLGSKQFKLIFSNIHYVILGKKTWIGYILDEQSLKSLPKVKASVFTIPEGHYSIDNRKEEVHQNNLYYARHYSIWLETSYLLKSIFN